MHIFIYVYIALGMIYGRMSVTFKYSQLPSMHMETYFFSKFVVFIVAFNLNSSSLR